MIRAILYATLLAFLFASCGSETSNNGEIVIPNDTNKKDTAQFVDSQVTDVIQSFSSPVEMSALIKDAGAKFNGKLLLPTNNADDYTTAYKQSLALGMLGVDLGYLNMYNKTTQIVNFVTIIKKLSDAMSVGQFFDFETLKRLATNNENVDSLLYISTNSFNLMDDHLRNNGRANLSALIVAGVWLEGEYIASQVIKEVKNKAIEERIGEQKVVLSEICLLLQHYSKDDKFLMQVSQEFESLRAEYANVRIIVEKKEAKMIMTPNGPVFEPDEVTHIEMTEEQLKNITNKTEQIRNKLISL